MDDFKINFIYYFFYNILFINADELLHKCGGETRIAMQPTPLW